METQSKYKILAETMRKYISKGNVGALLPSEADLLIKHKASRNTLRSALRLLREEGLIDSKAGIGTKIISLLPTKTKRKTVQVILPTTGYQFFYEIMDGINAVLGQYKIILQYKNCNNSFKTEQQYLQDAIAEDFDGLIYMSYFYANKIHFPDELNKTKKVVLVNNKIDGFKGTLITSDNEGGAYQMVSHMIKMGHRKIIHLGGAECSSHQDRKNGYIRAMNEKSLELHVYPVGSGFQEGYEFITKTMKKRDIKNFAYFCANDFSALGCCKGLEKLGLKVPSDISVAGFGGLNDQMGLSTYTLTTMKQNAFELGRKSAQALVDLINDSESLNHERQILLPVSLVKPGSVRKKCIE